MSIARATENAAAAPFAKIFGIKPLPDPSEANRIIAVVFHNLGN